MSNGSQRAYTILFFLMLFIGMGIFMVGADAIVHSRVGFSLIMLATIGAVASGSIWGLRILCKGAWRMVTDQENRKFNGFPGALGLIMGFLFCGAMLWASVRALLNLVKNM